MTQDIVTRLEETAGNFQYVRAAVPTLLREAAATITRLRGVLAQVEYIDCDGDDCPWCRGVRPEAYDDYLGVDAVDETWHRGHKPNCPRQCALGSGAGEGEQR